MTPGRRMKAYLMPDGDGDVVKVVEVDSRLSMVFTWAGYGWTTAADERHQLGVFDLYWDEPWRETEQWWWGHEGRR